MLLLSQLLETHDLVTIGKRNSLQLQQELIEQGWEHVSLSNGKDGRSFIIRCSSGQNLSFKVTCWCGHKISWEVDDIEADENLGTDINDEPKWVLNMILEPILRKHELKEFLLTSFSVTDSETLTYPRYDEERFDIKLGYRTRYDHHQVGFRVYIHNDSAPARFEYAVYGITIDATDRSRQTVRKSEDIGTADNLDELANVLDSMFGEDDGGF
jgi:hypothetical protein